MVSIDALEATLPTDLIEIPNQSLAVAILERDADTVAFARQFGARPIDR